MNCYNLIEKWAEKVKESPKIPLSDDQSNLLILLLINKGDKVKKIDNDPIIKAQLEDKVLGLSSMLWLRIKHCHTYKITTSLCLFLVESGIVNNPGKSTMMANYMQYVCHKNNISELDLQKFGEKVFPYGIPSEETWETLWEEQKIYKALDNDTREKLLKNMYSDNILDYPGIFLKSLI